MPHETCLSVLAVCIAFFLQVTSYVGIWILSFKFLFQEDIVAKLLDFLVAPHATTTVLLAEKDQVCLREIMLQLVTILCYTS